MKLKDKLKIEDFGNITDISLKHKSINFIRIRYAA